MASDSNPPAGGELRLGAHMSIAGGLSRSVERALSVDATALQIFVKSSRQWAARPIADADVREFRDALDASGLAPYTVAHASYLINLAAPDEAVRARSLAALADELDRCALLGVPFLVLHPGSHVGTGEEAGLARVSRSIDKVFARRRGGKGGQRRDPVTLLLEITAGQGSNLGARFEHLAEILSATRSSDRLGVCFDTCHALAAGYEFRDRASYETMFDEFDTKIGLDRLAVFHLNDSKGALGSRIDRHQHIGQGEVGLDAFRMIVRDPRFGGRPMVLETPKSEDLEDDRRNLGLLRELAAGRAGRGG